MTLRPGAPGDADALTALFLAARRRALPGLAEPHSDLETRWWMEHVVLAGGSVTVAVVDGEAAGFCAVRGRSLDHLYVHPDRQGRGIGSRLLGHAKRASRDGLSLYVFQRNRAARAFYERHGFRLAALSDGADNEEREPDALYQWRLSAPAGG